MPHFGVIKMIKYYLKIGKIKIALRMLQEEYEYTTNTVLYIQV